MGLELQKLHTKLKKIETALSKCRGSVLEDGWQTMRYAKKMRKWDYYAQEKMKLLGLIEDLCLESRMKCSTRLICNCPSTANWDGACKMYKK